MRTTWKLNISTTRTLLHASPCSKLLAVDPSGLAKPPGSADNIYAWVELDPSVPFVERHETVILHTGLPVPEGFEHFDTVLDHDGYHVWHVYVREL